MVLQDGLVVMDSILGTPVLPLSYPCRRDPVNQMCGLISRVGAMMPERSPVRINHFVKYCQAFIHTMTPLSDADIPSLEEALKRTKYPNKWCDYLRQVRHNTRHYSKDLDRIQMFIKLEPASWGVDLDGNEIPGEPRCINAQSELATSILLPFFQEIDKRIFNHDEHKYFIKGYRPSEIPHILLSKMGLGEVMTNDFSSFEAHHSGDYAYVLYYLFMHMIRGLSSRRPIQVLLKKMVMGVNRIDGMYFTIALLQRMMSGVLWTSSGNGFLNLMFMSYISQVRGDEYPDVDMMVQWTRSSFSGVVEGDDSIMPKPSWPVEETTSIIRQLGLNAKVEIFESVNKAGFCGVQCDSDSMVSVRDPIKAIRKMQAIPMKYSDSPASVHRALLRGAAISGKDIAGDTPVFGAYCDWVLRATRGYDVERYRVELDSYNRESFDAAVRDKLWQREANVRPSSRGLVEQLYGIPVALQYELEHRIRQSGDRLELPISLFMTAKQIAHSYAHLVPKGGCWPLPENPPDMLKAYMDGLNSEVPLGSLGEDWRTALAIDRELQAVQFFPDDALGRGA